MQKIIIVPLFLAMCLPAFAVTDKTNGLVTMGDLIVEQPKPIVIALGHGAKICGPLTIQNEAGDIVLSVKAGECYPK